MQHFSDTLCRWYLQYKRDLPWRNTQDPYHIWLSEVIMQQTRVDQGLAYYNRFTEAFPTVADLADASEDEVLKLWQGLGYYSRARNLHAAAKTVKELHAGVFPSDYASIRALKGVGDYTAAAVASFAFGLPHAVVDGNVYRVLSRVFGIRVAIDSTSGKKAFAQLANELLPKHNAATHNQAMMEFGAMHCTPANPSCGTCIFSSNCAALAEDSVRLLPVKEKKTKVRNRYFNYIVLSRDNSTVMRRRAEGDIWTGLHDFPLVETAVEMEPQDFLASPELAAVTKSAKLRLTKMTSSYQHILSHQKISARFWVMEPQLSLKKVLPEKSFICSKEEVGGLAIPRLIERFLEDGGLE